MIAKQFHSTSVVIEDLGVLIRGKSGIGKSDLALRLIDSGATLISDDLTICKKTGETIISVDKQYTRPSETDHLLGDASKAKKALGWKPSINFKSLVNMMVEHDLKRMKDNNFWF